MRASDKAYASLRDDVLQWRIPPGTVLAEVEQAERLGMSRTPVREAFARLVADGLLASLPGRGLVVTELSRETVTELFHVRRILESEAARLVALRRDPEPFVALAHDLTGARASLHGTSPHDDYYALVDRLDAAMDDAAGNRFLVSSIRQLRPHLVRARRLARDNPARLAASADEHLLIVEAILDGDGELAAHAMNVHLALSLKHILSAIDASAPAPSPPPASQKREESP